jgi:hypothetical protein
MEDVGIFYGHLDHLTVFCYLLWTFGIVPGNLEYFFPFLYCAPRKSWQPCYILHTCIALRCSVSAIAFWI